MITVPVILDASSGNNLEKTLNDFGGKNFSFFKTKLTELLVSKIWPIGVEIKRLLKDEKFLISTLKEGNLKANSIAENNLNKIYNKVGLIKI